MSIRVTRARRVVINPVPNGYESIELFASIADEFDSMDSVKDLTDWAAGYDDLIDALLQGEMDAAAAVTTNQHSIVHDYRFTEKED